VPAGRGARWTPRPARRTSREPAGGGARRWKAEILGTCGRAASGRFSVFQIPGPRDAAENWKPEKLASCRCGGGRNQVRRFPDSQVSGATHRFSSHPGARERLCGCRYTVPPRGSRGRTRRRGLHSTGVVSPRSVCRSPTRRRANPGSHGPA